MPSGIGVSRVPLGPFTSSSPSRIVTVTFFGTVITFFPMRLMTLTFVQGSVCQVTGACKRKCPEPGTRNLINLRQHLAAYVLAARALARHQAARGRDDVDAVATQHLRNFGRAHVNAPAGRRDAREVRDRTRTARVVSKEDAYR